MERFAFSVLDCHNRYKIYPNVQESRQYVSHGGVCVEICSNETAGEVISYKSVSKLRAALLAIISLCAYNYLEEMTGNFNLEV